LKIFPMTETKKGLLIMHYGTPASLEDVETYYTHIRRGRAPSSEQLLDLVERYRSIGGPSPLTAISERQAELIREGVRKRGIEAGVYIGAKHTHPFVAEAVEQMANDNVTQAAGLVLAPHYSGYSIDQYRKYATDARDRFAPGMALTIIERWGTLQEFIEALANRVQECLEGWDTQETLVIFSAHSLPVRILANGDPYKDELLETARLVADRLKLPRWTFAFQSASATGEPWLGPDILEVIETESKTGIKNLVACTVGFVSDHLEVLYDLGVEARDKCAEVGLQFRRARTLNDDPIVMDALAGRLAELFN
jgi:ferrochelatase